MLIEIMFTFWINTVSDITQSQMDLLRRHPTLEVSAVLRWQNQIWIPHPLNEVGLRKRGIPRLEKVKDSDIVQRVADHGAAPIKHGTDAVFMDE